MPATRDIHCIKCENVSNRIPKYITLYKAVDGEGNTHIAMYDHRKMIEDMLKAEGIPLGKWKRVSNSERIEHGLCAVCEAKEEAQIAQVAKGGIFFSCTECGQEGVLPMSDYTMKIRSQKGEEYCTPNSKGEYPLLGGTYDSCSNHTIYLKKPTESLEKPHDDLS